jgi:hypothetical protein
MKFLLRIILILLLPWHFILPLHAQNFQVKKQVAAAGGKATASPSYHMSSTLGQPSIGKLSSASYNNSVGFQNLSAFAIGPNRAPYGISISKDSVFENIPAASLVGLLATADSDVFDSHTYSLVGGTGGEDSASFAISGNKLETNRIFNFEDKTHTPAYHIRIKTDDHRGGTFMQSFTIHILDANDPTVFNNPGTLKIREELPAGTLIDTLIAVDEDTWDHQAFSLPAGVLDNSHFTISGDLLESGEKFNYESRTSYAVTVVCTDDSSKSVSQSFSVNIINVDEIPPKIHTLPSDFPQTYLSGSGNKVLKINADDNVGITLVNFYHKGIGELNYGNPVNLSLSNAPDYTVTYNENMLDEMGMDFKFVVSDSTGNKDSVKSSLYLEYDASNSPSIPGLRFGGKSGDYQIISVPYKVDNKITTLFSAYGASDTTLWRLLTWNNPSGKYDEYDQSISRIDIGTGYWFNAVNEKVITVGAGTAVTNNQDDPFTRELRKGWNQFGNPYPFPISWEDVRKANPAAGLSHSPYVFNGGITYDTATIIQDFRGAFVFSDTTMTISIPPIKAKTSGRIVQNPVFSNPINDEKWVVQLNLGSNGYNSALGGFGMNPGASLGADPYDEYNPPPLFDYLDIRFKAEGPVKYSLTRDVVPLSVNHTWEFNAETSLSGKTRISWDNQYFGSNDLMLILYDVSSQAIINMRDKNEYSFDPLAGNIFRIYFGDRNYIEKELYPDQNLLSLPFPNPFSDRVTIPFDISGNHNGARVTLEIFDTGGRKVISLADAQYRTGFYQITWEGDNYSGKKAAPGLYLCILQIDAGNYHNVFSRKIIKH